MGRDDNIELLYVRKIVYDIFKRTSVEFLSSSFLCKLAFRQDRQRQISLAILKRYIMATAAVLASP